MIRVIVADDHAILRQGLVKLLCSSGGVAVEGECCNGREVLQLIVYGLNNKTIAQKLGISIKTVESHRNNIMHKCATHTTADLVRYAIKMALVK